jgi:hypothetical protein
LQAHALEVGNCARSNGGCCRALPQVADFTHPTGPERPGATRLTRQPSPERGGGGGGGRGRKQEGGTGRTAARDLFGQRPVKCVRVEKEGGRSAAGARPPSFSTHTHFREAATGHRPPRRRFWISDSNRYY